jgi:hypothetical protein
MEHSPRILELASKFEAEERRVGRRLVWPLIDGESWTAHVDHRNRLIRELNDARCRINQLERELVLKHCPIVKSDEKVPDIETNLASKARP